jgi:thymidylate synthase (FAD)
MKVELLDHCGGDLAVVNAARVSFDKWKDEMDEGDEKLVAFLLKNRHGTPFEHTFFKFRVECPIFVIREWHRHRTHSYNEMSGRYTELPGHFYLPAFEDIRVQVGKPGHYTYVAADEFTCMKFIESLCLAYEDDWKRYKRHLEWGIAKELARIHLPVGLYSKFIWSCNARSLMHFLSLRNAPQAMLEIRRCAEMAEEALKTCMPITHEAFIANNRTSP